jgi:hypothetical protein
MNRLDAMLGRLPPLYRDREGSLLHGLVALFGMAGAAFDEDMDRVQRAHWVDHALDRGDLAKLGELFEIAPAAWEPDDLYRARLKATIAARFAGAVTRSAMEEVLIRILDGAQKALGVRFMELAAPTAAGPSRFRTGPPRRAGEPAFVEFPTRRRRVPELAGAAARLRPLDRAVLRNRGLHPVPLACALTGVAGGRTAVPVLANLTTGQVVVFAGLVPCGRTLRLEAEDGERLVARLGSADVSDRIYTGDGFVPGADFEPVVPHPAPRPIMLERGTNELWFFPLALFDADGLDAYLHAMPDLGLVHGRFGGGEAEAGTPFDASLFEQPPSLSVDLWWDEAQPAAFRFEIPAGAVLWRRPRTGARELDQERLLVLLRQTIAMLRAAGVDGDVLAVPLRERQGAEDRVRVWSPLVGQEEMRVEARLAAISALFDLTARDGSRLG